VVSATTLDYGDGCTVRYSQIEYERLKEVKALRAVEQENRFELPDEVLTIKRCPRCHEQKPLGDFYHDRTERDGHTCRCKVCILEECRNRKRGSRIGRR
jgi:hypothetical protein